MLRKIQLISSQISFSNSESNLLEADKSGHPARVKINFGCCLAMEIFPGEETGGSPLC